MTLGGIIYLQSIADRRMKGATRRNIDMFHQLCGDKALSRVVLGTTNWGEIDEKVGSWREEQLAMTFWDTMIDSGSKLLRFDRTEGSARAFLDAILDQLEFGKNGEILSDNVLRIQNEFVVLNRNIPDTAAGQRLCYTLDQLLEIQREPDFEKLTTFSNIEKQIKNDPKMKSLPVMILYFSRSFYSYLD